VTSGRIVSGLDDTGRRSVRSSTRGCCR
jgi:hypothetical protein